MVLRLSRKDAAALQTMLGGRRKRGTMPAADFAVAIAAAKALCRHADLDQVEVVRSGALIETANTSWRELLEPPRDPVSGRCDSCPRPGHHHGRDCWVHQTE